MMKTRKIGLLAAIAILGCVCILQRVFNGPESVRLVKLADKADTLEIARPDGSSERLVKDGDRWLLGDKKYPADGSAVAGMLAALEQIRILGTVSGSGDYERYGLDEAGRLVITARKAGKAIRTVTVGKNAVTGQQSYVLLDGGKDVLLVSGNFRDTFDKAADKLRNMDIWAVSPEGITGVAVSGSTASASGSGSTAGYALEKSGEPPVWTVVPAGKEKAFSLDAEKTANRVQGFASLRADSFAPEGSEIPAETIAKVILTAGGKHMALAIHRKGADGRYFCSSSESPYPFYLGSYAAEKFLKPLKDLGK